MASFKLLLQRGHSGESRIIEFTAPDPFHAFYILETEEDADKAILWEGEKRIGTLERHYPGFWQLTE